MTAAEVSIERVAELEAEVVRLRQAVENRTVIGQAQGILIAREHVTADTAFDMLRRASQRENRKVVDIAAQIVARSSRSSR